MPEQLSFVVDFHTPFSVGGKGSIPGTAIKGMMLDAARDLCLPWEEIRKVFGGTPEDRFATKNPPTLIRHDGPTPGNKDAGSAPDYGMIASPWAWSDMTWEDDPAHSRRSRIRVDPMTGTVSPGALLVSDEYFAQQGVFQIDQLGPITGDTTTHRMMLEVTARCVTAFGGTRRRGLGWVSVHRTPTTEDTDPQVLAQAVAQLRDGQPVKE